MHSFLKKNAKLTKKNHGVWSAKLLKMEVLKNSHLNTLSAISELAFGSIEIGDMRQVGMPI